MVEMRREALRIGAVAARAGVHIQTLRYYERRGLFDKPQRSPSGYREYGPETVRLVRAIKSAQSLGFRLAEIHELARLGSCGAAAKVLSLGGTKLREIDEKIRALRRMRKALRTLIETCACGGDLSRCRVIEDLDDGARRSTAPMARGKQAGRVGHAARR